MIWNHGFKSFDFKSFPSLIIGACLSAHVCCSNIHTADIASCWERDCVDERQSNSREYNRNVGNQLSTLSLSGPCLADDKLHVFLAPTDCATTLYCFIRTLSGLRNRSHTVCPVERLKPPLWSTYTQACNNDCWPHQQSGQHDKHIVSVAAAA